MALGSWDLQLKAGTPKSVRDEIQPFYHVLILPASAGNGRLTSAAVLAGALYNGVVTQTPGRSLKIGGFGLAWWMEHYLLDEGNAVGPSTASLSLWIDNIRPPGITLGTVTSPGGTLPGVYQWVSSRAGIQAVCDGFGVEWRVNPDFTLDAGGITDLYGSTPTAITTPGGGGGGDHGIVGLESVVDAGFDYSDYATKIIVMGPGGRGIAGGHDAVFCNPTGNPLITHRFVETNDAPPGAETTTAATILAREGSQAGREVNVSAHRYGLTRQVKAGESMFIYDPEFSLFDTANQQQYQGRTVYPLEARILGVRWPVQPGMTVLVRDYSGGFFDLTDYVELEEGDATLEVSWQFKPLGQRVVSTALKYGSWNTYTPTWTGSLAPPSPAIGNGFLSGRYRRAGTTLGLSGGMTYGSSTSAGNGFWSFGLPAGFTASSQAAQQIVSGNVTDVSAGTDTPVLGTVSPGGTEISFQIAGVVPFTWATGDRVIWSGTIEIEP